MKNKKEKFTPGPWRVIGKKYVESTVSQLVASMVVLKGKDLKQEDENAAIAEANAHLIAAAPEMFEALERLVGVLQSEYASSELTEATKWNVDKALIALTKARGES